MTDYATVLTRRYAGRQWKLDGDDYAGLTMLDDGPKPTKQELDNAWPDVAAEIAAEVDQRAAIKTSARAKLKALGLTDAEITALVG